jgi:hypothetical protein
MEAYIQSLKAKVEAEMAYSPAMKGVLTGLVDEAAAEHPDDPTGALAAIVKKINNAGVNRSRELAKFVSRCLYQFTYERGTRTDADALAFLNDIVQQKI